MELENLALRHQLHVLRRQRPGRLRLFTFDRLLWVLLYRLWSRCLEAIVLVNSATVTKGLGKGGVSAESIEKIAVRVWRGHQRTYRWPLPATLERPWTRNGIEPCARWPFDLYGEPQSESQNGNPGFNA